MSALSTRNISTNNISSTSMCFNDNPNCSVRRTSFGKYNYKWIGWQIKWFLTCSHFIQTKGHVAGEAVNKVVGQIQQTLLKVIKKSDTVLDQPCFHDLVKTITDNEYLWNEFCIEVRKNNITTNIGSKEYLFHFIKQNEACIKEQYYVSNSFQKESMASSVNKNSNVSGCFGNIKRRLSFTQSEPNVLCSMLLQSCKDEVDYTIDQKRRTSESYVLRKNNSGWKKKSERICNNPALSKK